MRYDYATNIKTFISTQIKAERDQGNSGSRSIFFRVDTQFREFNKEKIRLMLIQVIIGFQLEENLQGMNYREEVKRITQR